MVLEIGLEPIAVQHAGGMLLTPVQTLVATLISAHGAEMQTSPYRPPEKNGNRDTITVLFSYIRLRRAKFAPQAKLAIAS